MNIDELKHELLKLRYNNWQAPVVVQMPDDKEATYATKGAYWDTENQRLVIEVD